MNNETIARKLEELAVACEKAAGPDRELDAGIALACQTLPYAIPEGQRATKKIVQDCDGTLRILWTAQPPMLSSYGSFNFDPLPFTASLDAAMTLVPEGCVVAFTNCDCTGRNPDFTKATAIVGPSENTGVEPAVAATPALALCAASLRARSSSLTSEAPI